MAPQTTLGEAGETATPVAVWFTVTFTLLLVESDPESEPAQSLAALADTGLKFDDKLAIIIVLDDYVFGHSLRAAGSDFTERLGQDGKDKIVAFMNSYVSAEEFPELRTTMGDDSMDAFVDRLAKAFNPDEWFETGLAVILDGLGERFGINAP